MRTRTPTRSPTNVASRHTSNRCSKLPTTDHGRPDEMKIDRYAKFAAMLLAFVLGDAAVALAKPTPPPGGANQINGVQGTLQQTVFNGTLRLKSMSLGEPKASDTIRPQGGGER